MRSGVGSGNVLGVSGGAARGAGADADADAELGRGAVGRDEALLAGSPLPSAKLPGKTSVGAPGSVEKRADEQPSAAGRTSSAPTRSAEMLAPSSAEDWGLRIED
jgi:hypothetical protein